MSLIQQLAEEFFAQPHVALLVIPGASAPLSIAVWYEYAPGGDIYLVTGPDSQKARRLREAGHCTLVVDSVSPPRYVAVDCDVVGEGEPSLEEPRSIAERYLPPPVLEGYLSHIEQNVGPEVRFTLRPTTWRSAGIG